MLLLTGTSDLLRLVTSAAVGIDVQASWVDNNAGTITPGRTNTQISTATTTTLVGSPAASTQRTVKSLTVRNIDAANPNTVTVTHTDGTTTVTMFKLVLLAGQTLQFNDAGWSVMNAAGNIGYATGVTAAGADKQVQFNDGGTYNNGDSGLTYAKSTGTLTLADAGSSVNVGAVAPFTNPVTAAGQVSFFARQVAQRILGASVGPAGLDSAFQPFLARNKVGYWNPQGNATTVPGAFGMPALTANGTATSRTVAVTNLATRMRRIGYPSSATAGTFAGARTALAQFSAGSGSNDGSGFFLVARWVESDPAPVSGRRAFVGMTATTGAFTNVEVSTLLNNVGICQLSTDSTQWYWQQAGSAAGTPVACGTSVGAPGGNSTTAWELAIFAPNSVANTYYLQLSNLVTGAYVTTTMTGAAAALPQSTMLLSFNLWATNNATALAVGQDLCSLYVETDN